LSETLRESRLLLDNASRECLKATTVYPLMNPVNRTKRGNIHRSFMSDELGRWAR
jgi:hypothetical protein